MTRRRLTGAAADERNALIVEAVRRGRTCRSIAAELGLDAAHVQRIVRVATGVSVYDWRRGNYKRAARDPVARFWAKVDTSAGMDGCWLWTGALTEAGGYGRFDAVKGQSGRAHRFAYELLVGPIPDGLLVCHHCDNPPCVNPSHLFIGTAKDNVADMVRKDRVWRGGVPADRQPRGERHYMARLTEAQVRELRARAGAGEVQAALAREYGVADETVSAIMHRRTWAHVA